MHAANRCWRLSPSPRVPGWYSFEVEGRGAKKLKEAEPDHTVLHHVIRGYLVGDRLVSDQASNVHTDPLAIGAQSEQVHLLEPGLDRFARISAGRVFKEAPLVYRGLEMPLGPEPEIQDAFLDRKGIEHIKGVPPALEATFRMECWHRAETERRRAELEAKRAEEERLLQLEEQRRRLVEQLGDGEGRRAMAQVDFRQAAQAALAVGGAELIDHRPHHQKGEWVVRFRFEHRRFECVCDTRLHIIDAGICLQDHATGEKGDKYFTLESLPSVIREANREGKLVVYRHV